MSFCVQGRVRFTGKDEAKSALEKAKEEKDGKIMIGESEVECRVLEGNDNLISPQVISILTSV